MAEALLAVEDAADGQAQLLGLVQEVGGEVGVGEVPPVLTGDEGVGQAEQHRLFAAVAGQGEGRDAGDVDGVAAGEDVVQNVVFRAEHAGSLQVDGDGTAGQGLDLLLKIGSGLADDGVQGVDLGIDQGDGGVGGSGCGVTRHAGSGAGAGCGAAGRAAAAGGEHAGCAERCRHGQAKKMGLLQGPRRAYTLVFQDDGIQISADQGKTFAPLGWDAVTDVYRRAGITYLYAGDHAYLLPHAQIREGSAAFEAMLGRCLPPEKLHETKA